MTDLLADGEAKVVTLHKRILRAVFVERYECMLQLLLSHAWALVPDLHLQEGSPFLFNDLRKNLYASLVLVLYCIREKVQ